MPDRKISEDSAITGSQVDVNSDIFPIVDLSEVVLSDRNKKITPANLDAALRKVIHVSTESDIASIDFNHLTKGTIVIDDVLVDLTEIQFQNETNLVNFEIMIETNALNVVIKMPNDCISNSATWDSVSKEWTALFPGRYRITGTYDGTNYWTRFESETYS